MGPRGGGGGGGGHREDGGAGLDLPLQPPLNPGGDLNRSHPNSTELIQSQLISLNLTRSHP